MADTKDTVKKREEKEVATAAVMKLPELTGPELDFMASDFYQSSSHAIQRQYALTDDDLRFLNEMDHAVYGGMIDLKQYVEAIRSEFPNLNEKEKNQLIGLLLAYRHAPLGDRLNPTAEIVAKEKNITLAKAPYYRVYTAPLTFTAAAQEVAHMVGIEFMGGTQERLRDLMMSRAKNIRTDVQMTDALKRPPDMGGLGLDDVKAERATASIIDIIHRAHLMTEEEFSEWRSEQVREKSAAASSAYQASIAPSDEEAAEAQEIADIAGRMPAAPPHQEVLNQSVGTVLMRLSYKAPDDYLTRRLRNIISTRLRDVRSQNDVMIRLTRDMKVGGLGLGREEAEKIAKEIEAGYNEFHGAIESEEKERVRVQHAEQEKKIEERRHREAEEHARWYEEKIRSREQKEAEKKQVFERLHVIARGRTTPVKSSVEEKEEKREREQYGELVPAQAVTAVPGASESVKPSVRLEQPAEEKARKKLPKRSPVPASQSPKSHAQVKVSRATAEAAKQSPNRPSLSDVQVVRQRPSPVSREGLTGPLQELGGMTIQHFRRLGNPSEAVQKIIQEVDVLESTSFEQKIAGIKAWQACPLQAMYLNLLAEAFQKKKKINDLVVEKRKAGEDIPSSEEIAGIIEINTKLRI